MRRPAGGLRWWALVGLAVLGVLAGLTGCATQVPLPPAGVSAASVTLAPAQAQQQADAAWARVLARFVNSQGEVDFAALAQDRSDLDSMVRQVAASSHLDHAGWAAQMAWLINAYNALSMYNVIDSGIPASHAGLNKLAFFVNRQFNIGGRWLSLYAFENEVIRPLGRQQADPRLHFALNCSALSCPVLPQRPFTAGALDAELARETLAFFARPGNFRIDVAERTVWLNQILDFYTEDFVPVPAPSLIAYANRYAPQAAPLDYQLRFTPYDWTVANSRRGR